MGEEREGFRGGCLEVEVGIVGEEWGTEIDVGRLRRRMVLGEGARVSEEGSMGGESAGDPAGEGVRGGRA